MIAAPPRGTRTESDTLTAARVLTHLTSLHTTERPVPEVGQIRQIITDLRNARPLADTAARPELAGWTTEQVIETVEWLGKFLARSRRDRFTGRILDSDTVEWLFPPTQDEIAQATDLVATGKGRSKRAAESFLGDWAQPGDIPVFIPEGWQVAQVGHDVLQSLATVVTKPVTDGEVMRFIDRTYRSQTPMMTAEHVYLLSWLGRNGLLGRLCELTDANVALAQLLLSAWQLLQGRADEASEALTLLTAAAAAAHDGQPIADPHHLRMAATRTRWLAPSELDRVAKALAECERQPSNLRLHTLAGSRLRSFAMWRQQHTGVPAVPAGFSLGQIQMICDTAGLLIDEAEEKSVRSELRSKLSELGLRNDLDREIGEGVRAWKLGLLAEFYTTREARAAGDQGWAATWARIVEIRAGQAA